MKLSNKLPCGRSFKPWQVPVRPDKQKLFKWCLSENYQTDEIRTSLWK
jgi:hypothetical protein